jgi:hypothetical protein
MCVVHHLLYKKKSLVADQNMIKYNELLAPFFSRISCIRFRCHQQIRCVGLSSPQLACCYIHSKDLGWFFFFFFHLAPDAAQVGEHTVTQKHLYTGLFVIGLPMFWWAGPFGAFFWLIGASSLLILCHASLLEPGVESDYTTLQETVWEVGGSN